MLKSTTNEKFLVKRKFNFAQGGQNKRNNQKTY